MITLANGEVLVLSGAMQGTTDGNPIPQVWKTNQGGGFRDLTGAQVRLAGEPRRVVGVVSMDALAVELDRELPIGTPVTLVGHGVLLEDHARVADTINYELACQIETGPMRARRVVLDA